MSTTESLDAAADRLFEAINARDPRAVAACFAVDYRAQTPVHPDRDFVGRDQVLANWTALISATTDLRAQVLRRAADAEASQVWLEWEQRSTAASGAVTLHRGVSILGVGQDGLFTWTRFYVEPVEAGDERA